MVATNQEVVRTWEEAHPDRYLFAYWLRRMAKQRQVRFTEIRDMLGVDPTRFNKMIKDKPRTGEPLVPTEAECKMLADFFGAREEFVIDLANRASRAMGESVVVSQMRDGQILRNS